MKNFNEKLIYGQIKISSYCFRTDCISGAVSMFSKFNNEKI